MPDATETLWTTLRDFATVVLVCIIAAIALLSAVEQAHAGGSLPPPHYHDCDDRYAPPRPGWTACEPDVRRYCPNVLPGGGRILSCLAGNKDRLTYGCRDALIRAWTYRR